ncbi:hypothetical protein [Streptomyces sp. H27-H5]|uniref:hypothetical protein n=1 Tax=Streptomyces sp. H27-H5 TaxID=2996460 RepID=UPI00226F1545|nr:hypothetical protein [Streptomyces sp. H27-H5]MCY0962987.1 hypothetical protein [Streptomyces sp. H27-H5]
MSGVVTTLLDALALLLIAAGLALGLWPYAGGFALSAAGVVVLAGSLWSARGGGSG